MQDNLEAARLKIQLAQVALRHGDKKSAQHLALKASSLAPELEQPWLILAAISGLAESLVFIEKALLLNPDSIPAQHALEWVNQKLRDQNSRPDDQLVSQKPFVSTEEKPIPQRVSVPRDQKKKELVDTQAGIPEVVIKEEFFIHIPSHAQSAVRAIRYLAVKALTIAATIFIGIFLTVLMTSQPSQRGLGPPESPFETSLKAQLNLVIQNSIYNGTIDLDRFGAPDQNQVIALTERLRNELGLNLPFLPRNFLWTIKALTFDWGQLGTRQGGWGSQKTTASVNDIIVHYLPNTMLLVTTTYLLVFFLGMPLSLYLARHYGNWVDRLFALLSPISSIPSWVFGILLLSIFAFQFRWLPFSGMYESSKHESTILYLLDVSKHMVLPVTAFVMSLLFQVVFAWRTFFVIYSEEDYVDLGKAKGLSSSVLEKQYILRPSLPYIITSFATTLISFWQFSMALEAVFRWPGLGWFTSRKPYRISGERVWSQVS